MTGNFCEMSSITDEELLAYADEQLQAELSTRIEKILRQEPAERERLRLLLEQRDQGNLGLGDIWRHERLSCPQRSDLGLFLINALDARQMDYISFHLEQIGCGYCQAILEEMRSNVTAGNIDIESKKRRQQLFASSAGLLRKPE